MRVWSWIAGWAGGGRLNAVGVTLQKRLVFLPVFLVVLCLIWLPDLPNGAGRLGADYAFWLPNLLAGYFWHATSGWWPIAWFNPSQCGGAPLQADPQGAYLSVPQLLTFAIGPVRAVQANFLLFAAAGCLGAHALARRCFGLSQAASVLAGALFMFNGFFAVRMMVGHLSFAPFMLLPAMAACVLGPGGAASRAGLLGAIGFGLAVAVMLQGGMTVLVLPAYLSLAIVIVMHALAGYPPSRAPWLKAAAGSLIGMALCAGKLAAMLALMGNLPRNLYPLPGFANIAQTAWVALRGLFFWPSPDMSAAILNSRLRLELHEFDYRVGPVPLVLMLAAAWLTWRRRPPPDRQARLLWDLLALLLLLPLALNTYATYWTAFLKSLPVIGASSSLLRWFAAYILPTTLGGALALDRLAALQGARGWTLSAAGIAATILALLLSDRSPYGRDGLGIYDPARIQAAWRSVAEGGRVPPVVAIEAGPDTSLQRQDAIVAGMSHLFCYDPLFGYRLENFPGTRLHAGSVFDETPAPGGSRLNLIDPACYVFPRANGCAPGDQFAASALDQEANFISWRPFRWAKPWWARLADWTSLVSLAMVGLTGAVLAAGTGRRIGRRFWPSMRPPDPRPR